MRERRSPPPSLAQPLLRPPALLRPPSATKWQSQVLWRQGADSAGLRVSSTHGRGREGEGLSLDSFHPTCCPGASQRAAWAVPGRPRKVWPRPAARRWQGLQSLLGSRDSLAPLRALPRGERDGRPREGSSVTQTATVVFSAWVLAVPYATRHEAGPFLSFSKVPSPLLAGTEGPNLPPLLFSPSSITDTSPTGKPWSRPLDSGSRPALPRTQGWLPIPFLQSLSATLRTHPLATLSTRAPAASAGSGGSGGPSPHSFSADAGTCLSSGLK